jgi:hypothetical protein
MEFLTFHNVNVVNPPSPRAPEVTGGDMPPSTPPSPPVAPTTMPSVNASITLDEQFMRAPLSQQLTLAAIACENGHKAALKKEN